MIKYLLFLITLALSLNTQAAVRELLSVSVEEAPEFADLKFSRVLPPSFQHPSPYPLADTSLEPICESLERFSEVRISAVHEDGSLLQRRSGLMFGKESSVIRPGGHYTPFNYVGHVDPFLVTKLDTFEGVPGANYQFQFNVVKGRWGIYQVKQATIVVPWSRLVEISYARETMVPTVPFGVGVRFLEAVNLVRIPLHEIFSEAMTTPGLGLSERLCK